MALRLGASTAPGTSNTQTLPPSQKAMRPAANVSMLRSYCELGACRRANTSPPFRATPCVLPQFKPAGFERCGRLLRLTLHHFALATTEQRPLPSGGAIEA